MLLKFLEKTMPCQTTSHYYSMKYIYISVKNTLDELLMVPARMGIYITVWSTLWLWDWKAMYLCNEKLKTAPKTKIKREWLIIDALQNIFWKLLRLKTKVLHPGKCKQNVSFALAIFHLSIPASVDYYFPEIKDVAKILPLIIVWWTN